MGGGLRNSDRTVYPRLAINDMAFELPFSFLSSVSMDRNYVETQPNVSLLCSRLLIGIKMGNMGY